MMRVLGVVTARGGSKGVPRKNLAPLLGRPLLAYTAQAALEARRLTRVVLSTDDDEIAQVGAMFGLEVPFRRPSELAEDHTPSVPVLQHALRQVERYDPPYDAIFTLQPTNPLRRAEDIDGAIDLFERTGADSVVSYTDAGERHPARMKFIAADGTVVDPPFAEQFEGQPRQTLPKMFLREGSVYVTRRDVLMEQNSLKGRRSVAWLVSEERARSIDTPFDLFIAEQMLLRLQAEKEVSSCAADLQPRGESARVRILIAESNGFSPQAAEIIAATGQVTLDDLDREGLLRSLRDVEVLWVRLRNRIDAEILSAAPRLRYILSATTGLNHIDLPEAERRGIEVISLQGESGTLRHVSATAEHTIALILALLRRLPAATARATTGDWNRDLFRGRELKGKTVGIVGYGRLGRMVAPLLMAFGARVLVADRPPVLSPAVPIGRLLNESDIVTLHVNLEQSTRQFFGREMFLRMKKGAFFVNTSRGELIDESALLEALRTGHLAGAALDVLAGEYDAGFINHSLIQYAREHQNLILTPHIAGCTDESMERTETFLARKFVEIHSKQQTAAAYSGGPSGAD